MHKSIFVLSVVLFFMTLCQPAVGGFTASINYSDDNCTIPIGRFISGGTSCPAKRNIEQTDCLPVPGSPNFYRVDAITFCNDTKPPAAPEGWYSIYLYFGLSTCTSSKTVNLIQISQISSEIRMMANILSLGLQPWNVSGACNNETGVITAKACANLGGSNFCPSGDFSSECTYNSNYQAAGYQLGCDANSVPVAPPVSPPTAVPQSVPSMPSSSLQNSGTKLTSYMAAAFIMAVLIQI